MKKLALILVFLATPLLAGVVHDAMLSLSKTSYSYGYFIAKSKTDCMDFAMKVLNSTTVKNTDDRILYFKLINNACCVGFSDKILGTNNWHRMEMLIDLYFGDE